MKKTESVNGGRWGTKFDAMLDTDVCDRYNNAEITVIAKIFLDKGNPAGNSRRGTANDSDGVSKDILRWSSGAWRAWKSRFVQVCRRSAHGKFWLVNNLKWNDFEDRGVKYFPNIWCRLKIDLVNSAATAHHTIKVYRVARSSRDFRSDFTLMDQYDNWKLPTRRDSKNKQIYQRASVHEFFHILGVRHVDHGKAHCPAANSGNGRRCYGVADNDMRSVMGAGMELQAKFAEPWRRAAVQLTGSGSLGTAADWQPKLKRHYPRTENQVTRGLSVIRRPRR